MIIEIKEKLEEMGYADVEFQYKEGNNYTYEGMVDSKVEIEVRHIKNRDFEVRDRYLEEKHYVLQEKISV